MKHIKINLILVFFSGITVATISATSLDSNIQQQQRVYNKLNKYLVLKSVLGKLEKGQDGYPVYRKDGKIVQCLPITVQQVILKNYSGLRGIMKS